MYDSVKSAGKVRVSCAFTAATYPSSNADPTAAASVPHAVSAAKAWDDARPDIYAALDRLGKAYLDFARTEPALYSAMFEAGVPAGADPALREAGERAFAVLRGAADAILLGAPAGGAKSPAADSTGA